jgi:hypothetical protein
VFKSLCLTFTLALASLATAQTLAAAGPDTPIPEVGFQIKPCSYFFRLKDPKDFQVARPGSFQDLSQFRTSDLNYVVKRNLEKTWHSYVTTNPLKIWSGAQARIQAVWVPSLGKTLTREDMATQWPGFEEGMKIFVDMSAWPILAPMNYPAMMVGLKITRLDPANKSVEYRYLEGTPSYGMQLMKFTTSPANPNVTLISHFTWFRSYSGFIEGMYPMYHRAMINGMHRSFRKLIESQP